MTDLNTAAADEGVLNRIMSKFRFDSLPVSCAPYGNGHINRTFLVTTKSGRRYILQRVSEMMTPDMDGLMQNVVNVTEYLGRVEKDPRRVPALLPAVDGKKYLRDESGFWRVFVYAEHTICLQQPRSDEDFYQAALSFGRFSEALKDYPIETLGETIPDFHNTPRRYAAFHAVIDQDPVGRAALVSKEISFLLEREEEMGCLQRLRDEGKLPVRVTHNDTKLNNVLFDEDTGEALCVIDLDTVMPGLIMYDFGDAIRFGASTAAEDEKDLSKVEMDIEKYRAFTRGFLEACPDLKEEEIRLFPMGAKVMTLEVGLRFLTDYIDGDHYFTVHYPQHNLDRARTQLKLVADMEKKWDEMHAVTLALAGLH